jgi:hypothetical protein
MYILSVRNLQQQFAIHSFAGSFLKYTEYGRSHSQSVFPVLVGSPANLVLRMNVLVTTCKKPTLDHPTVPRILSQSPRLNQAQQLRFYPNMKSKG